MDTVENVFYWGLDVQNQGDLPQAIYHFTNALEIFHSTVGAQYDRLFWARILFARAEVYLLLGQYCLVEKDVKQALNDCSEQCRDLVSQFIIQYLFPYNCIRTGVTSRAPLRHRRWTSFLLVRMRESVYYFLHWLSNST